MTLSFKLVKKDKMSRARAGVLTTPNGKITTPAFAAVATRATVRGLDPSDLKKTKTQVVLGNAYHLYLHPGLDTIGKFGGFSKLMKWEGPTITDSGGYQVSFIWNGKNIDYVRKEKSSESIKDKCKNANISDEGMRFRSHIDGTWHLLTPEKSIKIQNILGADIIMAFDQPMGRRFSARENKKAWERSLRWEERSFVAWKKLEEKRKKGTPQALFGIVQGQTDKKMRMKFLKFILDIGFPGIAVGDETIGSDPKITAKSLDTIAEHLPDNKPVHALGLGGGPEGIFAAIERGVDLFDNSSITRMARTGLLFIYPEDRKRNENRFRINIKRNKYHSDTACVSKVCGCYTCANFTKSYLHHLFVSSEILGMRLATIHNLFYINDLMQKIRNSIKNNDFSSLKKYWVN